MVEDGLHRAGLGQVGEHHAAATAGAGEHALAEDPQQQLGPGDAAGILRGRRGRRRALGQWCEVTVFGCGEGRWNYLFAPARGRGEDAVVAQEVGGRRRNQRGEAAQQLPGFEKERRATVAEGPLETVGEPAVGELGEPLLREGRSDAVAAQMREALSIVRVPASGVTASSTRISCRQPSPKS